MGLTITPFHFQNSDRRSSIFGLVDYIKLGDNVSVAAKSGVTKDISSGLAVAGFPAIPINEWRRHSINPPLVLLKFT